MSTFEHDEELETRVRRLHEHPERLARYDLDTSGALDDDEWRLVRRLLAAELAYERRRGAETPALALPAGLLGGRFEVIGLLGAGGQARTWLADDRESGGQVALKELRLDTVAGWKAVELFEREGQALEALRHPAIPAYVHAFHDLDDAGRTRLFLAQSFVDGAGLDATLETTQWDERRALALMKQVLGVLAYLHGHSPPVIHRDIKPSNLIERPDGSIAVIDFGAVQRVLPDTGGGSTVIGTHGYMPLEQYMGRAVPQTDLYALGATVVHLMSRVHPSDLPLEHARLGFEPYVQCTPGFRDILGRLLAPSVEQRFASAGEVLRAIEAHERALAVPAPTPRGHPDLEVQTRDDDLQPLRAPDPVKARRRLVSTLMSLSFFVVAGQGMLYCSPRCAGSDDAALAAIRECPEAREALGPGIRQGFWGCACSNGEASGNCSRDSFTGSSNGTMVVVGDRGRGRLSWGATMHGCGNHRVGSATLSVDGRDIAVVPCATRGVGQGGWPTSAPK